MGYLVIAEDANGVIAGYVKGVIASGCGFPACVNGTPGAERGDEVERD